MGYKTTTNKEFKEKGFVDLDKLVIISTNKKTPGAEYDIREALQRLGSNGDEIEVTIKKTETVNTVEEE